MIVRRNLKWSVILKGAWRSLLLWFSFSAAAYALYFTLGLKAVSIPFAPVAVIGTALSIFLGFRNSSSYERWWEARKIWGGIVNTSRSFTRQVISLSVNGNVSDGELKEVRRALVYRHLAWVHAMRLQLRRQTDAEEWSKVAGFAGAEWGAIESAPNRCTMILLAQSKAIAAAQRSGIYDDFRHMQLDNTLNELFALQGQCERIKNTPLPRQYDFFNRLFLLVFMFLLPFSLLETFADAAIPALIIPFTMITGFIFYVVEGVGRRIENPFENRMPDVPMSALCRTIEIDLRAMLGETDLPPALQPVDGFLY